MNVAAMLRRIEAAAEQVRLAGARCLDCGGPVPSLCPVLVLGPQGMLTNHVPCGTCAEAGGGGSLAIDPRTSRPAYEPKLILLNLAFEDWWATHGAEDFPGAVGSTLRYHRALQLEEDSLSAMPVTEARSEARCARDFSIDPIVRSQD